MIQKIKYPAILLVFYSFFGCATVISDKIREEAVPDLQLKQVSENPDSFKGKTVIWGGEIVETVNQKDGTALVIVYQRPLTYNYAPDITSESEGRFIIKADKYLDPYAYRKGRKITTGGAITGGENRREGEIEYWYTVLTAKELYLWDEYYYRNADPFYHYYDPFWHYPYYYDYPPPRRQYRHGGLPWP